MDTINFIKTQSKPQSIFPIQKTLGLLGIWLILFSASSIFLAYFPIAQKEISYRLNSLPSVSLPEKTSRNIAIKPVNTDFGLVISKIGVNTSVTPNVDLNDQVRAETILEKNVAHALGSSLPGQKGTTFLYGHSAFLNILGSEQNSVFYLLDKLEKGDEVDLFYNGYRYLYSVTDTKITEPEDISFLLNGKEQLVLQTCWPLGTNLKRFVVIAKPIKDI